MDAGLEPPNDLRSAPRLHDRWVITERLLVQLWGVGDPDTATGCGLEALQLTPFFGGLDPVVWW